MDTKRFKSRKLAFLAQDGVPASAALLGGKGAGLVELTRMNERVPPFFTISTGVARAYAQHQELPLRLAHQLDWRIKSLEKQSGKTFGSEQSALLVSVRSGAEVSMPGMMDTVLNLGINPAIASGIARQRGATFAYDCYRRFLSMFGSIVLKVEPSRFEDLLQQVLKRHECDERQLPGSALQELCNRYRRLIVNDTGTAMIDEPRQQLEMAIMAVLRSWNSTRAMEYRRINRISNNLGTAVNVVAMVYGNLETNSCTGVAFSRNVATGKKGMWGEFRMQSQGEDLVSGTRTPQSIDQMRHCMPQVYEHLVRVVEKLEQRRKHVVEVEFTVESGELFFLQVRDAKMSPEASVTVAVHGVWDGVLSKDKALLAVKAEHVKALQCPTFQPRAYEEALLTRKLAHGQPASPGCATGRVVSTSEAAVVASKLGEKVILVRPDTSPSDLPGMLASVAIVTKVGGSTCHAGVVARELGKPCIVAALNLCVADGDIISVDGSTGVVLSGTCELDVPTNKKEVNLFLKWAAAKENHGWRAPRLNFNLYRGVVSAHQLIADFYMAEALSKALSGHALAKKAKALRIRVHTAVAETLAMYLLVAIGGEVRHAYLVGGQEVDVLVADFKTQLRGDRRDAQESSLSLLEELGLAQQVRYVELVKSMFSNRLWARETAYGGPRWAAIAAALLGFLKGDYSHSVFADHTFDLQHNAGTVFGKHPMIHANRDLVDRQLQDKKEWSVGLGQLYRTMNEHLRRASAKRPVELDEEIEQLFREGEKRRLWFEPAGGATDRVFGEPAHGSDIPPGKSYHFGTEKGGAAKSKPKVDYVHLSQHEYGQSLSDLLGLPNLGVSK